jgi:glycosyltransferase involved in cell wall biosynthesis
MNSLTKISSGRSYSADRWNQTKVLHLITLSVLGGAQDNTFGTCELHDRRRYEVHLACNPDGQWVDRAREAVDVFHPLASLQTPPHPIKDLRTLWDMIRLLRRERFDVVHTHTAKAGFLGRLACWICRVPVVVHTYHAFPFHDYMSRGKNWLFRGMERLVRPMTSFIFTLSDLDRDKGQKLGILDRQHSATAYTGIDFAKLDAAAPRETTREKLGIAPDCPVVLQVGRMEAQKAPQLLVEAFAQVVREHPRALLLFAGDGELRPQVEAAIRAHDLGENVRILGFRKDIPDLLEAADIFAFSSLWEAMGRAMVEAMLVGRAVVVPAIYGIPEIVRHRKTGWLYEVGNVTKLAQGISHLLAHPDERAKLGCEARRLTRSLFDLERMVTKIEATYVQTQWQQVAHLRHPFVSVAKAPAQSSPRI